MTSQIGDEMIHAALLARRTRTPAVAIIRLVGACLILIEIVFFLIDDWHPWSEHNTHFIVESNGDLEWMDGSSVGCAVAYHPFNEIADSRSTAWHLDVYLGRAWATEVKSFDLPTTADVMTTAERWCK